MTYYPKNKIKTNQVTTDTDTLRISSTGEEYNGFYYKLYDGKIYTGRFPGDGLNQLLEENKEGKNNDFPFPTYAPALNTSSTPPLYPTEQDYKNGMFLRYFSKKRNEYLFKELTKDQYDTLNNPRNNDYTIYQPFFIKWMLTGEQQKVADFNFYSIKGAEDKEGVLGLNEYLKMDYLQYYK
jgi:hypothetical protein